MYIPCKSYNLSFLIVLLTYLETRCGQENIEHSKERIRQKEGKNHGRPSDRARFPKGPGSLEPALVQALLAAGMGHELENRRTRYRQFHICQL